MFAKSYGAVTFGVDGRIIDVEVDVSYGFPAFDIVGLLDTAVKESRERVRTAIKNTGVKLKPARVTINLAPADIRKDSSGLDLPIAVGLLAAYGLIPAERIERALFAAELSLEGELRSVRGVLSMTVGAKEHSFREIFVAPGNGSEALLVDGIRVYAPKNLRELYDFLLGKAELLPLEDAAVTVARVNATLTFPSCIILVVAMNEVTSITIQCDDAERTLIFKDFTVLAA